MLREYFCQGCGLFHWDDLSYESCPNEKCISNEIGVVLSMPVDTMMFAYYSKSFKDIVSDIGWSSHKYASDYAIKIYRKQGVEIRD